MNRIPHFILRSCILIWQCSRDDVYPRETPPHIRTAQASPQRHTAAGTAAPTTADTGNTVPCVVQCH